MISLHLLDASTLITAHNSYYPLEQIPEFWSWLQHQGEAGRVKIPQEIMDEVTAGRDDDPLVEWISRQDIEQALLLKATLDVTLLQRVVSSGYAPDLTDVEIEGIGRDPFLIAYALANPAEICVVSVENSKPTAQRQNRRIPDVCNTVGVECCGPFTMNRRLGFHTGWKSSVARQSE